MPDKELSQGYIRSRYRDLEPLSSDQDNKSFAQYTSAAPVTPLGHFEVTVDSSGELLPSIPAEARRAVLYSVTGNITFTDTAGDTPSATHGMIIPTQTVFVYDSEPTASFKLWAASATVVRIAYYG